MAVAPLGPRGCLYGPHCPSSPTCFEFTGVEITTHFLADGYRFGDCDGDGMPNGADPTPCAPLPDAAVSPDAAVLDDTGTDAAGFVDAAAVDAGRDANATPLDADLAAPSRRASCACRVEAPGVGALGWAAVLLAAALRRARLSKRRPCSRG
ncbi:MAG: hypothetical protein K1X94_21390 [Sandaracinaceae bacterium]|nr:hypothetical protein [Sandaracinaceae bacterium]